MSLNLQEYLFAQLILILIIVLVGYSYIADLIQPYSKISIFKNIVFLGILRST